MRLLDSGEIFGHFAIPIGGEEEVRKALSAALPRSAQRPPGIRQAQLTTIAGECDLLLHLQLQDFRLVSDLQAEVIDSQSFASSWVYAIPYGEPMRATRSGIDLEFFIYLRVHRHFYACYGASGEAALYEAIQDLLESYGDELSGRVLYSLGWPDLIVHGGLSSDVTHLRSLILSLQSLSFPTRPTTARKRERRTSVFLKTITVVGLPMALSSGRKARSRKDNSGATFRQPVVFCRAQPGLAIQALRSLGRIVRKGGASSVASWAINGTWDIIVAAPGDEQISLAQFEHAIRLSRKTFAKHGIERTQTHLLTSREDDLDRLKARRITLRPRPEGPLLAESCECSREEFKELRGLLRQAVISRNLPKGLTRTISHALDMFRHTLRDSSNCCDSAGALRSHSQGLRVLLNLSVRSHEFLERTTDPVRQSLIATEISHINDHIAEWCKRAGRVVREKTAGSAARLFLQIDSIVAQRGAIPKILMIAERIMKDFYDELPVDLHGPPGPQRSHFAAILEPQGNVTSQPLMGLVSIPIRYAFALHLVVPQLWHEVGQYVFWAEHSPLQKPMVDLKISRHNRVSPMTPSRQMSEAFATDFHLRADMFADLLVFRCGFGGNLKTFFLYLASLTANVAKHDNLHPESWKRQALALVHRLCFVAQFAHLYNEMRQGASRPRREFTKECRRIQKVLTSASEGERTARYMVAHLQELSEHEGWPREFQIPPNLACTVAKNLQGDTYALCLRDMEVVAYALKTYRLDESARCLDPADWERIEEGFLVKLESSRALQTAYREFYIEELKALLAGSSRPRRSGQFRKMATLGRSALLRIYQSEVSFP